MSIWKRLQELISPQEPKKEEAHHQELERVRDLHADEKFALLFNEAGGHFLYCEDEKEVLVYLQQIIAEETISRFVCFDTFLQRYLTTLNVPFIDHPSSSADFNFILCEYLIAYDGSIMLSSNQLSGRKLQELPDNYVVFARAHQICKNTSEGLHRMNAMKNKELPTNITCIRGKEMHQMNDIPNAKNIYLLMID